jgi:hypothetical protein
MTWILPDEAQLACARTELLNYRSQILEEIGALHEMAEVWSSQLIELRIELKKLVDNDNLTSGELRREIRRLAEEL